MRTPLARVLGLGSARSGTEEFFSDRIRAVVLALLTPYMIGLGVYLFGRSRESVIETLSRIWVGPAVLVFIIVSLLHMRLGMQVIIEDYIHHKGWKLTLIFANWVFTIALGAANIFALLLIIFRPAP
ncbi:MAG TPA: succinate dehydrogenase, hydrophobic membrane anchor protein [Ensifer sp.]|nr:succinate dehydrogenase, hydrophobic membrane anchor protein [Ensifer sp.]